MKIVNTNSNKVTADKTIVGAVYKFNKTLYMRVSIPDDGYNEFYFLNFTTGYVTLFDCKSNLTKVDVELQVK